MKHSKLRWLALMLAIMVAATLVAGCGSSGSTTTSSTTSTETKTDSKTDQSKPADTFQKDPNTSLALDKAAYKPGENIVVKFTAPASYSGYAWIGIVPSTVKHGSEDENDKNDVDFDYLAGKTQGEITLVAPDKAGDYDVRMNTDDDPTKGKEVNYVSFKVQ